MALLFAPLLFVCAVIYVAYPLLKETSNGKVPTAKNADLQSARQEREDVIEALRDIEMDYRMGKLSSQDYESLKSDFEQRAVEAFKKLESLEKSLGKSGKTKS